MNLFYLIANKNPRFARSRNVSRFRLDHDGLVWRGARIGSLQIDNATECRPFRSRPGIVNWFARAIEGDVEIAIRFTSGGKTVGKRRMCLSGEGFNPIVLPWPVDPVAGHLDLEIYCTGETPAFIASHFDLDRKVLFSRCKGKGAELGPGPNPHILPSNETDVIYVEQKSPAEWVSLYGEHYKMAFNPALAPYYVIGDAHAIPAGPGSLDFIYSSHVFEHLVNPLGHLEIWSGLLRKGGEVLMVVPDYIGSKDYLADPTGMEEIVREFGDETFAPSFHHYERYAEARRSPAKAKALFESKSSIHMHYYSNSNMSELLELAVQRGYFDKFTIIHSANAKDFHVILTK
jgi:SAM-dependent methyltransferase